MFATSTTTELVGINDLSYEEEHVKVNSYHTINNSTNSLLGNAK